ncbi:MAG: hypothetical protein IJN82_05465, partial [Clostridia bacterium]|nr:hypothetical protein [Clostridia bacterium]
MNVKRWTAILLIFCLAICGMTACKSKDDKKSATAGGYVEGAPEDGGDHYEIIGNQGGGNHVTEDNDGTTTPDPDTDTDGGNTEQPGNQTNDDDNKTDDPKTPDTDGGKEDEKPVDTPNNGEEEEDDELDYKYKDGNKIKILDYNLRCANDPEGRSIKERSVRFREVMKKYQPDVCGFQEIVPEWVTYLAADYPDYGYHIEYRSTTSKEGTMVMWNTKTMEMLEEGHFWLSDTPDVMSKADSWGETQFYRIVAWAKVKVKATGSTFIYYSTHQNNAGTHPVGSAQVINAKAKAMGVGTKFAGLCMGD